MTDVNKHKCKSKDSLQNITMYKILTQNIFNCLKNTKYNTNNISVKK